MKKLTIKGTDAYIDCLKKSLEKDYKDIDKNMKISKVNEKLIRTNDLEELEW